MCICSVTLSLGCLTKADLVLLIDSSSSVGQEDFQHLEDFVKDLVVQLPIGQDQVSRGDFCGICCQKQLSCHCIHPGRLYSLVVG